MNIGERIKKLRLEQKMTVDEIAKKLGINRATFYRYESNEIEKLPTSILEPLAKILGVTPQYLMGWSDSKNEPPVQKDERNIIRIAGRDGRYIEKRLTDEQIDTLKQMIEALPDVPDDL